MNRSVDIEKYKNTPYIKTSFLPNLEIITPQSGMIDIKAGDTIHFEIKYPELIEHLQINTNVHRNPAPWEYKKEEKVWNERALKKQKYVNFKYENGIYTFDYVVKEDNTRFIDILFDYQHIIRFRCTERKGE